MKKVVSTVLSVCFLMALSINAFAATGNVCILSEDSPVSIAHIHSFKNVSSSTQREYCWATGGEHTATWTIRRCSCGAEVCTNTKNSCGKCPTGGSVRSIA